MVGDLLLCISANCGKPITVGRLTNAVCQGPYLQTLIDSSDELVIDGDDFFSSLRLSVEEGGIVAIMLGISLLLDLVPTSLAHFPSSHFSPIFNKYLAFSSLTGSTHITSRFEADTYIYARHRATQPPLEQLTITRPNAYRASARRGLGIWRGPWLWCPVCPWYGTFTSIQLREDRF